MRRRLVLVVVLVAGAVIAAAGVLARGGNGDGPLDSGVASGYGQDMEVGQTTTMGHVWLFNHGTKPAVLERVRILGAPPEMELIDIRTLLFPNTGESPLLGNLGPPIEGFPTSTSLAEGDVVPVVKGRTPGGSPEGFLQLLIGVRTTKLGLVHSRAVEITYRVGDRRYKEVLPHRMALCTPRVRTDQSCPSSDARGRFGDRVLTFPPPKD